MEVNKTVRGKPAQWSRRRENQERRARWARGIHCSALPNNRHTQNRINGWKRGVRKNWEKTEKIRAREKRKSREIAFARVSRWECWNCKFLRCQLEYVYTYTSLGTGNDVLSSPIPGKAQAKRGTSKDECASSYNHLVNEMELICSSGISVI